MPTKSAAVSPRWSLINAGLLLAVIWTAVTVIDTTHLCRQHYAQLQALQSEEWNMQENWSRLLLEESTWAAHHRVQKLAQEKLAMRAPAVADIKVVLR
jgi:cell division protein FtsL